MSAYSIPIQVLEEFHSKEPKNLTLDREVKAIHSGRLGDIIYALPTCRSLGVNHLLLNVFLPGNDGRRIFSLNAARQLVPLLLAQSYIQRVSIVHVNLPLDQYAGSLPDIDYNLDAYRNVARHQLRNMGWCQNPQVVDFSQDQIPIHLVQVFAAAQRIPVYPSEPWLEVPAEKNPDDVILVSLTPRWRSFPAGYWPRLLQGLRNVKYIGLPSDGREKINRVESPNHLELARAIAGSKLFLGTISFPYSLAESLKVNRLVEVCHSNLNAYPLHDDSAILSLDILEARNQVAEKLDLPEGHPYRRITQRMRWSIRTQVFRLRLRVRLWLGTRIRHFRGRVIRSLAAWRYHRRMNALS